MTPAAETLAGRCAAVTGAGRGFGEQAAFELAKLGASVAVFDVDAEAAERCAAGLSRSGARALALACDVSDDDAVHRGFERVRAALAPVDILVNNAGIVSTTEFLELTVEEFDRILAVDYTSMWSCCRAVLPGMVERRFGRIVNISSVAGKSGGGFLGRSAYAAA